MSIKVENTLSVAACQNPWLDRDIRFPCLGKALLNNDIVLFKSMGCGTVISSDNVKKIGSFNNLRRMKQFTPVPNGVSVTITQKLP